jgi:hypothetical protein
VQSQAARAPKNPKKSHDIVQPHPARASEQDPSSDAKLLEASARYAEDESLLAEIQRLQELQLLNGVFVRQQTAALISILASVTPCFSRLCIQGDARACRPCPLL